MFAVPRQRSELKIGRKQQQSQWKNAAASSLFSARWSSTLGPPSQATIPCARRPHFPPQRLRPALRPSSSILRHYSEIEKRPKVAKAGDNIQPCSVDWPKRRFQASRPGWVLFVSVGCGRFHGFHRQHCTNPRTSTSDTCSSAPAQLLQPRCCADSWGTKAASRRTSRPSNAFGCEVPAVSSGTRRVCHTIRATKTTQGNVGWRRPVELMARVSNCE